MAIKATPTRVAECHLEYRVGSSDKVYMIWIENVGANHYVKFQYGRRGSSLNSGVKVGPTHALAAKEAYLKVIKEKLGKGYKDVTARKKMGPATTTVPKTSGSLARLMPLTRMSSMATISGSEVLTPTVTATGADGKPVKTYGSTACPQLLNPISEEQMLKLMKDDKWFFQEKHDGRRMTLSKNSKGLVLAWNRKGQVIVAPEEYCSTLQKFGSYQFILDGEACGDKYYAFDILSLEGQDQVNLPLEERLQNLGMLLRSVDQDVIQMVYTAESFKAKDSLLRAIREGDKEGVAIKDKTSIYTAGRPNSGGPALKFKLVESVSCVVTKVNDKRSVQLAVGHNPAARTALINVGNVTIPINFDMPKEKDIVEIRYLYAYKGGSLYQPVFLGVRDDVPVDTVQDLKFKPTTKEE
jgi:bifunctional non-homologous end joining protein LigD